MIVMQFQVTFVKALGEGSFAEHCGIMIIVDKDKGIAISSSVSSELVCQCKQACFAALGHICDNHATIPAIWYPPLINNAVYDGWFRDITNWWRAGLVATDEQKTHNQSK